MSSRHKNQRRITQGTHALLFEEFVVPSHTCMYVLCITVLRHMNKHYIHFKEK